MSSRDTCIYNATRFSCGHQIAAHKGRVASHSATCTAHTSPRSICARMHATPTSKIHNQCWYCDLYDHAKNKSRIALEELTWWGHEHAMYAVRKEKIRPYFTNTISNRLIAEEYIILYNTYRAYLEWDIVAYTAVDKLFKASVGEFAHRMDLKGRVSGTKTGSESASVKNGANPQHRDQDVVDMKDARLAEEKALAEKVLAEKVHAATKVLSDKLSDAEAKAQKALDDKVILDKSFSREILTEREVPKRALTDKMHAETALKKVFAEKAMAEQTLKNSLDKRTAIEKAFQQKLVAEKTAADQTLGEMLTKKSSPARTPKQNLVNEKAMVDPPMSELAAMVKDLNRKILARKEKPNKRIQGNVHAEQALQDVRASRAGAHEAITTKLTLENIKACRALAERRLLEEDEHAAAIELDNDDEWEKIGVAGTTEEPDFEDWLVL